jgi:hypothetical protein
MKPTKPRPDRNAKVDPNADFHPLDRPPKIKVGYYITVRARDHLRRLARQAHRTCSAQLELLIEQAAAQRRDDPEPC